MSPESQERHIANMWTVFTQGWEPTSDDGSAPDCASGDGARHSHDARIAQARATFWAARDAGVLRELLEDENFVVAADVELLAPLLQDSLGEGSESAAGSGVYRRLTPEFRIVGNRDRPASLWASSSASERRTLLRVAQLQSGVEPSESPVDEVLEPFVATGCSGYSPSLLFRVSCCDLPMLEDAMMIDGALWVVFGDDHPYDMEIWDLSARTKVANAADGDAQFVLNDGMLQLDVTTHSGKTNLVDFGVKPTSAQRVSTYDWLTDAPTVVDLYFDENDPCAVSVHASDSGALITRLVGSARPIRWAVPIQIDCVSCAVTIGEDGLIRVWNTLNGECIRVLQGGKSSIGRAALTTVDGVEVLVTASVDCFATVWNLRSGKCLHLLECDIFQTQQVCTWQLGNVPLAITAGDEGNIRLWDLRSGECLQVLAGHGDDIRHLAVARIDGSAVLVSVSDEGYLAVWNLEHTLTLTSVTQHTWPVQNSAVLPGLSAATSEGNDAGPQILVTVSADWSAKAWCIESGEVLSTWHCGDHNDGVPLAVGYLDGEAVAITGSADVPLQAHRIRDGKMLHPFDCEDETVESALCKVIDGRLVVLVEFHSGRMSAWDVKTGQHLRDFDGSDKSINALVVALFAGLPVGVTLGGADQHGVRAEVLTAEFQESPDFDRVTLCLKNLHSGLELGFTLSCHTGQVRTWDLPRGGKLAWVDSPASCNALARASRLAGTGSNAGDFIETSTRLRYGQNPYSPKRSGMDFCSGATILSGGVYVRVTREGRHSLAFSVEGCEQPVARYPVGCYITDVYVSPDQQYVVVVAFRDVIFFRINHDALQQAHRTAMSSLCI